MNSTALTLQPLAPSDRRTRLLQLLAVLAVAFLLLSVTSILAFLRLREPKPATQRATVLMIVYQSVGLGFLVFILRRQKRRPSDIGFSFSTDATQIQHSFGLLFWGLLLNLGFRLVVIPVCLLYLPVLQGFGPLRPNPAVSLGTSVTIFTLLFVCINPFHEELMVRAFLISEVEYLYGTAGWAIFASVALQTSYHLYQGLPVALSHIPMFVLFSLYYVRTRQIFPVVLAHLYVDLIAVAFFAHRLP